MMHRFLFYLVVALVTPGLARAQSITVEAMTAPAEPYAIALGTGGVEGATQTESWVKYMGMVTARNVQRATLTPVLPNPGKATGAAVIVAPGGGFAMLSMENEGWPVARWLADHGVAAFILKYRLKPTPASVQGFQQEMVMLFREAGNGKPLDVNRRFADAIPRAVADASAALKLVRARAKEWRVDPTRVGMLGFSAGAITTLQLVLHTSPATMPAFIAPIYGPMDEVTVPAAAPPLFAVLAVDDPIFGNKGLALIDNWSAAKKPVELHLYQRGSHGFGMGRADTTTMQWLDSFRSWLEMNGMLKSRS